MSLQEKDFGDFYNISTLPELNKGEWEEVASQLTSYPGTNLFFGGKFAAPNMATVDESIKGIVPPITPMLSVAKSMVSSGKGILGRLMVTANGNGAFVGVNDKDPTAGFADGMVETFAPWRHFTFNFGFNDYLVKENSGVSQIIDYLQELRAQAYIDSREKLEKAVWSAPSSANDNLSPLGLKFWLGASQTQGYNGTFAYSSIPGATLVDQAAYPAAKNWTDKWTALSNDGFTKVIRKALTKINWQTVSDVPVRGKAKKVILMGNDLLEEVTSIAEKNNDQLGPDLATYSGMVTIRGVPIIGCAYIDAEAVEADRNKVYLVDATSFQTKFLAGSEFTEMGPTQLKETAHHQWKVDVDATFNIMCSNPRRHAVISKTT